MSIETTISPYQSLLNDLQTYRDLEGRSYPRIVTLNPSEEFICDIDLNAREIALPSQKFGLTTDAVFHANKDYYRKSVVDGKTTYVPFEYEVGAYIKKLDFDVFEKYEQFLSVETDHNAEVIYFRCPRYFGNMDLTSAVCVVEYINAHGDASLYWVPSYDVSHYETDEYGNIVPMIIFPWAIHGAVTAYEGTVKFAVRWYQLNSTGETYYFNMSTQPKEGKILHGLRISDSDIDLPLPLPEKYELLLQQISEDLSTATTYWIDR